MVTSTDTVRSPPPAELNVISKYFSAVAEAPGSNEAVTFDADPSVKCAVQVKAHEKAEQ